MRGPPADSTYDTMNFQQALAGLVPAQKDDAMRWAATIPESWLQGRSAFGGLQVALAVRAMRRATQTDLPLRVAHVIFIAPVPTGPVAIAITKLREGSSVLHVEARLMLGTQVACVVTGVFGRARESSVRIAAPAAPPVRAPEVSPELPQIDGVSPRFARHIEFLWAEGALPFSGGTEAHTRVWMRFRDARRIGEAELLALADAIPTPALGMLHGRAAASSLTWTIDFLRDTWDVSVEDYWRIDTEATAAADGYVSQTGTLYDGSGQAVLLSRQCAVVFG